MSLYLSKLRALVRGPDRGWSGCPEEDVGAGLFLVRKHGQCHRGLPVVTHSALKMRFVYSGAPFIILALGLLKLFESR